MLALSAHYLASVFYIIMFIRFNFLFFINHIRNPNSES